MSSSHLSPREGEGLRPEDRLRQRRDFLTCYRRGRRFHGNLAILHVHPNERERPRLGITASRKVGKAVVRQRMKRRIRETFRRWDGRSDLGGVDLVFHLRPGLPEPGFEALSDEIESLLRRLVESNG